MSGQAEVTARERKIVHAYSGHRSSAHAAPDDVASLESRAALRQLSLERLMAYGVHHADAVELRGRVWAGEAWREVAAGLAEDCLQLPEREAAPVTRRTRINRLLRASALLRMSQMMMLQNSQQRSAVFARAGQLFEEAAALAGDRSRLVLTTPNGPLTGWLYPSLVGETLGRVLVIGGVEGWAMDFAEMGLALAERGIEALVLDGPGQGESRMVHGHFLTADWEIAYQAVFDTLERSVPARPIGMIGNSMGGSFAMHLAARDPRIKACCNNGGTSAPFMARANPTFFLKMTAHIGDVSPDEAAAVWATVKPADAAVPVRCPLLVVHGGLDPLVSNEDARHLFSRAASSDKQMVVFSDGDHCIYNHADDKHALIGDWMASRLAAG